jgi:hypothetical protein
MGTTLMATDGEAELGTLRCEFILYTGTPPMRGRLHGHRSLFITIDPCSAYLQWSDCSASEVYSAIDLNHARCTRVAPASIKQLLFLKEAEGHTIINYVHIILHVF